MQNLDIEELSSMLTAQQVAAILNFNVKTVYGLAKEGALTGYWLVGAWRFKRQDVKDFIESGKQSNSSDDDLLTIAQICKRLHIGRTKLYAMIKIIPLEPTLENPKRYSPHDLTVWVQKWNEHNKPEP